MNKFNIVIKSKSILSGRHLISLMPNWVRSFMYPLPKLLHLLFHRKKYPLVKKIPQQLLALTSSRTLSIFTFLLLFYLGTI